MSTVFHGGRLDDAVARFGGERAKWLDLSTGINPNPYPVEPVSARAWSTLPDREAWESAASAARDAFGVAQDIPISLAGGSQQHIQALPRLFKPQAVAIVGFTYQEHGVQWGRAGHEVYVTDGLESAEATARIIIVVNPNNPDGRICDREALSGLSRRLAAKGGLLLVDEAFGEVTPRASVAGEAGRDGLVVLRSLGKFYGLAGARFGAALGPENLIRRLEDQMGPWAVSGPALELAARAYGDTKWQKRTAKKLSDGREQLEETLSGHGFDIVGGTSLFVLVRHARAEKLYEHLGQRRILARNFPGKPEWLRFGLPAKKPALRKLDKALADYFTK